MHDVYLIGLSAGAGAALGLAGAGVPLRLTRATLPAAVLAGAVAAAFAWLAFDWPEAIAAAAGAVLAGVSAGALARRSLRRGGTAAGTAFLLLVAAVAAFALALIPLVGYLEAAALPAFAARARRRAGEKYAGLRSLAR